MARRDDDTWDPATGVGVTATFGAAARAVARLGARLSANRRAVGIDLRQDRLAALRRVGFDDAQPTVWIAEHLLVGYLPRAGQNRLPDDVTAVSPAGGRFAADHMPTWTSLIWPLPWGWAGGGAAAPMMRGTSRVTPPRPGLTRAGMRERDGRWKVR